MAVSNQMGDTFSYTNPNFSSDEPTVIGFFHMEVLLIIAIGDIPPVLLIGEDHSAVWQMQFHRTTDRNVENRRPA